MNNLDIVLALFTTPNHRFSRLDTTAAFQATTNATSKLFPTVKPMSSTSKTVLNSYDS
jgi:F0F1-type ATP synthase beta subunit